MTSTRRIIFFSAWTAVALMALPARSQQSGPNAAAPTTITLQDALTRAQANEPQFRAALTDYGVAKENRVQSRAALLPNVNYNAGFIYTQGNGTSSGRFIAANGVHEYLSEGNGHQALKYSCTPFAAMKRPELVPLP